MTQTITTKNHKTPPLKISQHKFGNNDIRLLITQAGHGVCLPIEDINKLIDTLQSVKEETQ